MAGNDRGKLKEKLEGIHKNADWIIVHSAAALEIIKDQNPTLQAAFTAFATLAKIIDDSASQVWQKI